MPALLSAFLAGAGLVFIGLLVLSGIVEGEDAKSAVIGWLGLVFCLFGIIFFIYLMPHV